MNPQFRQMAPLRASPSMSSTVRWNQKCASRGSGVRAAPSALPAFGVSGVGLCPSGRRGAHSSSLGRRTAVTQAGLLPSPGPTLREGRHQAAGTRAPPGSSSPSLPLARWHRPLPSPRPSGCRGGRGQAPSRVPGRSRVLPPKSPALLRPRPPLLQPRLGRLPGRLLQALCHTKELGGGRDPVPDVRRAPGQHQHARGAGLHQQWAGAGREGTPVACSLPRSLINQSPNE